MEKLDEVQINPELPDRVVLIGAQLASPLCEDLITALRDHQDCFAWSFADMIDIDPSIITHRLLLDPNFTPIQQKGESSLWNTTR